MIPHSSRRTCYWILRESSVYIENEADKGGSKEGKIKLNSFVDYKNEITDQILTSTLQ